MAYIDIDVDDYLDEADSDCMIEELKSRVNKKTGETYSFKEIFEKFEYDIEVDEMIEILSDKLNFNIIQSQKLKTFINTL